MNEQQTVNTFRVVIERKNAGLIEAGTIELRGGEVEADRTPDATAQALGELTSLPELGMLKFRNLAIPREEFYALRVDLVSRGLEDVPADIQE